MGGCGLDYIKRAVAEGTPARGWLRRWRAYVGGEDEEVRRGVASRRRSRVTSRAEPVR